MTRKTLASFMEQLRSDATLQADFAQFASEHGFAVDGNELSEQDLESIAGGIDTVPLPERQKFGAFRAKTTFNR